MSVHPCPYHPHVETEKESIQVEKADGTKEYKTQVTCPVCGKLGVV